MAGNPHWNSAVLALHMDGANNSIVFSDVSPSAHAVTAVGNAKISTAAFAFGGASAFFDGAGAHLQLADSDDWNLSPGIFTIEFWAKKINPSGYFALMTQVSGGGSSYNGIQLFLKSTGFTITGYNNNVGVSKTATFTPNAELHHYEICQDATSLYLFYDGALVATHPAIAFGNSTGVLRIGIDWDGASSPFNGYIDDFQFYNGITKHTASFTPPINPFAEGLPAFAITGTVTGAPAGINKWRLISTLVNGVLDQVRNFTGNTYTLDTDNTGQRFLTLIPFIEGTWTTNSAVSAGFIISATGGDGYIHLFSCSTAGTTGGAEPVWNLSGATNDGSVIWSYLGPLVQPLTQGPLIPA